MLKEKDLEAIEEILKRGNRVELLPTRNCVRIYSVDRKEVESIKTVSPPKNRGEPTK